MDRRLSGIIDRVARAAIDLLDCYADLERYNRQLNEEELVELQKQIDKLGSNKTLEDLLLK